MCEQEFQRRNEKNSPKTVLFRSENNLALSEGSATQICYFYFLSPSAYLFAYFFLRLSFSFFLPLGLSYFLNFSPTLPRYPHPFRTFYLPLNTTTSNIDILPAVPLVTCREYRCHPLPKFSFLFLSPSFSFLRIRKFSYCLSFSLFLSLAFFFVPFFLFLALKQKMQRRFA